LASANTINDEALDGTSASTESQLPASIDDVQGGLGEDCYAAVDLGSNSFHLVISRYIHGEFVVLDRQREVVRLAAGLDDDGMLTEDAANRALACLSRFGQLLRNIPRNNLRAVGTNALRRLKDKKGFLERAESALGHSIEIIAGREEARLIYLGVSKWSAYGDESRLVIDIGGGSTEIIAGKGEAAVCRESLEVGCVVLSKQYFADGRLSKKRFKQATLAAELAIQPVVEQFRLQGWTQIIGCSGTMKSMAEAIIQGGYSKDRLNRDGLLKLRDHAINAGHVDKLELPGVSSDRLPVFGGGLAILLALFELFDIHEMQVSDIALREGVLYDLVGRRSAEDIRDVTVSAMLLRWSVDAEHVTRVRDTAFELYDQVAADWDIRQSLFRSALGWASALHEVGLQISHDGYHKHGAYLLENADMAGFARRDQLLLAALVIGHRRKFPIQAFEALPSTLVTPAKRVAVLLRLAVLLHRGRGSHVPNQIGIEVDAEQVRLTFEPDWLNSNPLTEADLKQERSWLKSIGIKLGFQ
jgi:exopolyphosphatase/guanosine-5'-triphosphate,3'-diphosphate pyrophosphatase